MNQRIKELEPQCWEINEFGALTFNYEKFAQLIVKECAEICLEANDHKNILRHFGVEQ